MNICIHCGTETNNPKFCSKSCAAKTNNKGVRRHGKEPIKCSVCGTFTRNKKFCSSVCSASVRKKPDKEIAASNAARQARYRARHGYNRAYAPTANKEKIKQIYENCPTGYEVDHIIPLSKGGLHHEDNLQYLTITENRSKGNRV
jgi:5-methylcytosine-specific restriction endonuclease McrA